MVSREVIVLEAAAEAAAIMAEVLVQEHLQVLELQVAAELVVLLIWER